MSSSRNAASPDTFGLTHIGLAADFANSYEAGSRVNTDDENVLGTIGDLIDLRQPEV